MPRAASHPVTLAATVHSPFCFEIALRTGRGQNAREHWRARARRVKAERDAIAWALAQLPVKAWKTPCTIRLTRVAPSNGLDDDNLAGSLKAVRDQVAAWLGVDDRRRDIVRYEYAQERGPWAVRVEWLGQRGADFVPQSFSQLMGAF